MTNEITSQIIADFLKKKLHGDDVPILKPADIVEGGPGDVVWCRSYSEKYQELLNSNKPSLVLCRQEMAQFLSVSYICCENPRLDFINITRTFFSPTSPKACIHETAVIHAQASIGENASIGPYSFIGSEVVIGKNCTIGSGVSITGIVNIGNNCTLKPNSVIGEPGFGFERDSGGKPVHFPHLGKIILGDNVLIGSCSTIERATLGTTRLRDNVKVDDLVQIGHNVEVMENTLIMAGTIVCGGVNIGKNCWIAPKTVIKEKIKIGDNVTTGLGAVVIRDVSNGLTVIGVPAKPLQKN